MSRWVPVEGWSARRSQLLLVLFALLSGCGDRGEVGDSPTGALSEETETEEPRSELGGTVPWVAGGNGPAWTLERGPSPRDGLGPGGWFGPSDLVGPEGVVGARLGQSVEVFDASWPGAPCEEDGHNLTGGPRWALLDAALLEGGPVCGGTDLSGIALQLRGTRRPDATRVWLKPEAGHSLRSLVLGPWDVVSVDRDERPLVEARLRDRLLRSLGKRPVTKLSGGDILETAMIGGNFEIEAGDSPLKDLGVIASLVNQGLIRVARSRVGLFVDLGEWSEEASFPESWVAAASQLEQLAIPFEVIPWWEGGTDWSAGISERLARTALLVLPADLKLPSAVKGHVSDWLTDDDRQLARIGEGAANSSLRSFGLVVPSSSGGGWAARHIDTREGRETLHFAGGLDTEGLRLKAWSSRRSRLGLWEQWVPSRTGVRPWGSEAKNRRGGNTEDLDWFAFSRSEETRDARSEALLIADGGQGLALQDAAARPFATLSLPEHWSFQSEVAVPSNWLELGQWQLESEGKEAKLRVSNSALELTGFALTRGSRLSFGLELRNVGNVRLPASTAKVCLNPSASELFAFDEHERTLVRSGEGWRRLATEWSDAGSGTYLEIEPEGAAELVFTSLDDELCLSFGASPSIRIGGNGNGPGVCLHQVLEFAALKPGEHAVASGSLELLGRGGCLGKLAGVD